MLRKILQPLYIIYAAIIFLIGLMIVCLLTLLISPWNTHAGKVMIFNIIKVWSRFTLLLAGMPVKVIGKPPAGRYILISNHVSYLDAANLFSARPDYFSPLGKVEMSKIPLFGFLYKKVVIPVDRSSPESRADSMRKMLQFLKEEGNIFIFPEGTFNETGNPLKDFYDGAFRLAITAQTPIVPLVFPNALDRMPKVTTFWPGRNRGIYLDPIYPAGMTMEDLPRLKQHIYTLMESALVKYKIMP